MVRHQSPLWPFSRICIHRRCFVGDFNCRLIRDSLRLYRGLRHSLRCDFWSLLLDSLLFRLRIIKRHFSTASFYYVFGYFFGTFFFYLGSRILVHVPVWLEICGVVWVGGIYIPDHLSF